MPTLADCPEIVIEFLASDAPAFDPGELGVAVAPPAIANALYSATGVRFRRLPLLSEGLMTWQEQSLPADHPAVKVGRVGVLLVNLGTPDAPEKGPIKRYLAEFLSDRRVVEIPAIAWQPILRGIILNTRPKKSAHAYRQVWTEEGSPLAVITRDQAEAMQQRLGDEVTVDWAMRYGTPSIPERIEALMAAGCERILLAPLYPQYSGATTATVVDKAADKPAGNAVASLAADPAALS